MKLRRRAKCGVSGIPGAGSWVAFGARTGYVSGKAGWQEAGACNEQERQTAKRVAAGVKNVSTRYGRHGAPIARL